MKVYQVSDDEGRTTETLHAFVLLKKQFPFITSNFLNTNIQCKMFVAVFDLLQIWNCLHITRDIFVYVAEIWNYHTYFHL